ncbi:hypothetical protein B0H14DRAFT_2584277 [Mycena olivaceomarginata]|nr:hypothetical protein B0H14DRAFT_2584277 [Mycena olivaceomarginata]
MPKPVPFAPKPAMAKLPLAVRKDIFASEAQISEVPRKFRIEVRAVSWDTRVCQVWTKARLVSEIDAARSSRIAGCRKSGGRLRSSCWNSIRGPAKHAIRKKERRFYPKFYVESSSQRIQTSEISSFISAMRSVLIILVRSTRSATRGETITSAVKDGVYCIMFRHDRLGYNQNWLDDTMLPAIESAPREGFSLSAKNSIENDYEAEVDEVRDAITKLCGTEFTLDPNFEEIYSVLTAAGESVSDKTWQARIGATVLSYFKGLQYQLERQGFKEDDMLQEGLQEIVETKTFKVRVVPKTNSTTETVVEDGVVHLQCAADRWGYSSSDMGEGLLKLL